MIKIIEHKIMTFEDICQLATEKNFINLMTDISEVVAYHIKLKQKMTVKEYNSLGNKGLTWKDDGISGMTNIKHNGEMIKVK
jgi:hypothetical protein